MRKRNGFTLVELLAVIVVLAIIMILAIPAVLNVMDNARRQSFVIAIDKYVTAVQQQYMIDSSAGGAAKSAGVYVYNITSDLGLTSTGANQGYVIVDARDQSNVHYYISMHDNNYQIVGYDITLNKMPESNSSSISSFSGWNISNAYYACQNIVNNASVQCLNKDGAQYVQG